MLSDKMHLEYKYILSCGIECFSAIHVFYKGSKIDLLSKMFPYLNRTEKRTILGSGKQVTIHVYHLNLLPMADQSRNRKQTLKCNQQCVFKMNWEVNTSWQVDITGVLCSGPTSLYIHQATAVSKSTRELNGIELLS